MRRQTRNVLETLRLARERFHATYHLMMEDDFLMCPNEFKILHYIIEKVMGRKATVSVSQCLMYLSACGCDWVAVGDQAPTVGGRAPILWAERVFIARRRSDGAGPVPGEASEAAAAGSSHRGVARQGDRRSVLVIHAFVLHPRLIPGVGV